MPDQDAPSDADQLLADFRRYDACVDIVSAAEVWFKAVAGLRETVAHFERYPTIAHPDGAEATPDFTTLFQDRTAYIGELTHLARSPGSLDSLSQQVGRYDKLTTVPGPDETTIEVDEVDVLIFIKQGEANAAVSRLEKAIADEAHPYQPSRFPSVFGWSFDKEGEKYVFSLARGEQNQRPRGHGRDPSLEKWMAEGSNPDTLTGLPRHFTKFKIASRFMNDAPPKLYMAALLWSAFLPSMSGGEGDVLTTAAELADQFRTDCGRGRAAEVEPALEFLSKAGLARRGVDGWIIAHQRITHHESDLAETLIDRYKSRPSGPVTFAEKERVRMSRRERAANRKKQIELKDGSNA